MSPCRRRRLVSGTAPTAIEDIKAVLAAYAWL